MRNKPVKRDHDPVKFVILRGGALGDARVRGDQAGI